MSLICLRIKNQFHINDFARSLSLNQRLEAIIKRPIHFWILLNFNSWGCALASRAWWPLAPNFHSSGTRGVHQSSENSPFTKQNSPANIRQLWLLFIQMRSLFQTLHLPPGKPLFFHTHHMQGTQDFTFSLQLSLDHSFDST